MGVLAPANRYLLNVKAIRFESGTGSQVPIASLKSTARGEPAKKGFWELWAIVSVSTDVPPGLIATSSVVRGWGPRDVFTVTVFILAPSRAELEHRLRTRSEDPDEVITRRLREAAEEIRNYNSYASVVINRDLRGAEATLSAIVRAERVRRTRIEDQIRPILDTFQI